MKKMLIVEYEEPMRFFLKEYFKNKFYIKDIASATEAVKHINRNMIAEMYEDVVMANQDLHHTIKGLLILDEVKKNYKNNPLTILVSKKPMQTGHIFLLQPFKIQDLEDIVKYVKG